MMIRNYLLLVILLVSAACNDRESPYSPNTETVGNDLDGGNDGESQIGDGDSNLDDNSTSPNSSSEDPSNNGNIDDEDDIYEEISGPYQPQANYNDVSISVKTDRVNAVYETGDTIYFEINAESLGHPVTGAIQYSLSNDGIGVLKTGILESKEGKIRVKWVQESPLIVRCEATYMVKSGRKFKNMAAAAVSPFEIEATTTLPVDFEDYWQNQIDLLSNIPINPELTQVNTTTPSVDLYDISLDNVGASKVYGYLGKPVGAGPSPAILYIPGAGVSSASQGTAESWASKGFLTFSSTVHDIPNGESSQFYQTQFAGPLKNYYLQGRENRDTYYFHRVILGCIQALNYLTGLPEWDGKHLIVYGSSQGGGLTLIITGLDERVTAAAANVPALNEHQGMDFERPAGWPQLVPINAGILDPQVLDVSRYYDAVNFSRSINVPMVFGVGLLDNTCRPTTVFSAFNSLKGEKQIDIAPLMGHDFNPAYLTLRNSFIESKGKD